MIKLERYLCGWLQTGHTKGFSTFGAAVRTGELRRLTTEAPLEWRPVPENTAFLGFFRFKEWMR